MNHFHRPQRGAGAREVARGMPLRGSSAKRQDSYGAAPPAPDRRAESGILAGAVESTTRIGS